MMKLKLTTLCLFLILGLTTQAQTWTNLNYEPDQPGLEENPLKGFATMWDPSNNFPHSIQGKLFGLDDVMSGIDNFDWTAMDDFLEQEAIKGNHAYLQVNIDPAFGTSDMPEYLKPLVDWVYLDSTMTAVPDSCPNWNDADLMAAMVNFIDSFGARYNSDERIFFVHLGLYGMWGEWHIGDAEDSVPHFAMTEANKTIIANRYEAAFPDKILLARYPINMPDPQAYGYSDGLFFTQSIDGEPWYFHNILKASAADLNWTRLPIGGEVDPDYQDSLWLDWPNSAGQNIEAVINTIHPTWLFCHHTLTNVTEGTAEWNNSIRTQKLLGYTLHIDQYNLSASGGIPAIEVNFQNKGVAPMYANWDIEMGAIDASGTFTSLGTTKWDINLIQPATSENYRSFISGTTLLDGTYTIVLRMINPLETISPAAKKVAFANDTYDASTGWLTLGDVSLIGGDAGDFPIQVTAASVSPTTDSISIGASTQLSFITVPSTASNQNATWISSDPYTATVNTNGVVTGLKPGVATITAYSQDGSFEAQANITVEPYFAIPGLIEAENFSNMSGIGTEPCEEGGLNVGWIHTGDWLEYGIEVPVGGGDFFVDYRVAGASGNGEITLIIGADTLDVSAIPATTWWQDWTTFTTGPISITEGRNTLRIFFSGGDFNLNWLAFRSSGSDCANLDAPVGLTSSLSPTSVTLSWAPVADAIGYRITGGPVGGPAGNSPPIIGENNTSWSLPTAVLTPGITYEWRVQAACGTLSSILPVTPLSAADQFGIPLFRSTAAEIMEKSTVELWPNPTSSTLNLNFSSEALAPKLLQVFDMNGVLIEEISAPTASIDVSGWKAGVYQLAFQFEDTYQVKTLSIIR